MTTLMSAKFRLQISVYKIYKIVKILPIILPDVVKFLPAHSVHILFNIASNFVGEIHSLNVLIFSLVNPEVNAN